MNELIKHHSINIQFRISSFDDKGRLFDKDGNLNKWWSDHALRNFHNRTKCLVQQYNKYQIPDIDQKIDGETTQGLFELDCNFPGSLTSFRVIVSFTVFRSGENIADGGGIHQAFDAYKIWLEQQTDPEILRNEVLPGMNMTSAQLFFLNFGTGIFFLRPFLSLKFNSIIFQQVKFGAVT